MCGNERLYIGLTIEPSANIGVETLCIQSQLNSHYAITVRKYKFILSSKFPCRSDVHNSSNRLSETILADSHTWTIIICQLAHLLRFETHTCAHKTRQLATRLSAFININYFTVEAAVRIPSAQVTKSGFAKPLSSQPIRESSTPLASNLFAITFAGIF